MGFYLGLETLKTKQKISIFLQIWELSTRLFFIKIIKHFECQVLQAWIIANIRFLKDFSI